MPIEQTFGQCRLCNRRFGKRQMTSHLKACWKQHAASSAAKKPGSWFHLAVQGRHIPDYWLHLQVSAKSTFDDLDRVLRRIWLECCGHMSAFQFPAKRADRSPETPFDIAALIARFNEGGFPDSEDQDSEELMGESLGSKLKPGTVFFHEYDFGSTTHLALRVAGEYEVPALQGAIKVLARNEPPAIPCAVCQKPATQLCQECEGVDNVFCDDCVKKHECGPDMLMPLVNSPRAGVCGYCGPSVEP